MSTPDANNLDKDFGPFGSETVHFTLPEGPLQFHKAELTKKTASLFVIRGSDVGLRIKLTKPLATLGRTNEADVVLNDELISRQHATISWDPEANKYYLTDRGSTNGTFVNDQPISETELKDGDKIFVGTTVLKFTLEDDLESEGGEIVDRLMFRDDLTGLVVKRVFFRELNLRIQEVNAQGGALSVLMMDMDGLKKVNDAHGHFMGAFIISEVGKIIGEICNTVGQACRYGGDEFVAYLQGGSREEAKALGEKIRSAVKEHVFSKDGIDMRVSISIGVAIYPEAGKSLDEVVKAADKALYRAKEKGRDIVSD